MAFAVQIADRTIAPKPGRNSGAAGKVDVRVQRPARCYRRINGHSMARSQPDHGPAAFGDGTRAFSKEMGLPRWLVALGVVSPVDLVETPASLGVIRLSA